MANPVQTQNLNEIEAFHAALVRARKEKGNLATMIPLKQWQSILARLLQAGTRQTMTDKTLFMDRLGFIQHIEGQGVIVLENQAELVLA